MSRVILIESAGVKRDFLGSYMHSAGSTTIHEFENVDFGPASTTGLLVLGAGVVGALSNIANLEVNGNLATEVANISGSGRGLSIFSIAGVSGTGTVRISSPNSATRWVLATYKLRGVQNTTANDTDSDSTTAGSLSFNVPKLGVGIAFAMADGNPNSSSFSGLTKDFEDTVGTGASETILSGASDVFTTAQSPLAVTATTTASAERYLGASWR
jgi:hypothetical protein